MRQVNNVKREKNTFNLSLDEFKSGDWLDKIKDSSEMLEISYKNHYLTISDCTITKYGESVKENKGDKNE
jgi:hypothetical protein